MELIKNPKFVMLGEYKELKARSDFKKELPLEYAVELNRLLKEI